MAATSVVAGGAGFLGSHLCDRLLLLEGHNVICIDNLITGSIDNISHLTGNPKFRFVNYDVTKSFVVAGPVDFVWNFASPASPIDYLKFPIHTLQAGAFGTYNLLEVAKAKKARFLQASTSEVYGDPLVHPQPETYWGNVNSVGPRGVYDEAKRFAEALVMAYHRTYGVETRIARIFNTYGERMRFNDGRAIPEFISKALKDEDVPVFGDGFQTRSVCYVSDLIDGIVKLMMSNYSDPMNIGNPDEITVLQLAVDIITMTESKSKIVFLPLPQDDPKVRQPDIILAKAKLDWSPSVSRYEGLGRTISYFKSR
jgi:dTDP-glucose 4,6-dehydratase